MKVSLSEKKTGRKEGADDSACCSLELPPRARTAVEVPDAFALLSCAVGVQATWKNQALEPEWKGSLARGAC